MKRGMLMPTEGSRIQTLEPGEALKLLGIYWAELSQRRQIMHYHIMAFITAIVGVLAATAAGLGSSFAGTTIWEAC
jgi:hypothetical protein